MGRPETFFGDPDSRGKKRRREGDPHRDYRDEVIRKGCGAKELVVNHWHRECIIGKRGKRS